jgi:hypothetical protein
MSGLNPPQGSTPIPVTARLSSPEQDIRFMKCIFPRNTFSQMATLSEFIVNYDHGPFEDTSVVSNSVPLFVDVHPGACPNVVMVNGDDNMLIAVLGSSRVSSGGIDVQTVGLNNRTVQIQSASYQDLATPFIGTGPLAQYPLSARLPGEILNFEYHFREKYVTDQEALRRQGVHRVAGMLSQYRLRGTTR